MPMPMPDVGGMPYWKGAQEVVVDDHCLVVALVGELHLVDEALLLVYRVVELRVSVGKLLTVDHQLETLGESRL